METLFATQLADLKQTNPTLLLDHPTYSDDSNLDMDELMGNAPKTVAIHKTKAPNGTLDRHFDYKNLGPKHGEILRLLSIGLTNSEVAMKMDVTNATVINVKYSREGRIKLQTLGLERDKMTIVLKDQVAQLGPLAVDTLEEALMDEETPQSVKTRTALQILEMNGLSRTREENVSNKLQDAIISQIVSNANNSGLMIVEDPMEDPIEDAEVIEDKPTKE